MRKISPLQIVVFLLLLSLVIALSIATTYFGLGRLPLGDFRGVVLSLVGVMLVYVFAILIYRLFLGIFPLLPGEIEPDSQQEFVYHVYLLSYLVLFYPVIRSGFVPVPLMRLFYIALGARMGDNTYSSGIILDPLFITLGSNTIVGQFALIVPHVIEGSRLAHYPVNIGDNVTIGAGATVLAGVTVGNDAIVSTGAVVTKGTSIGNGEIWGGIPARLIGRKDEKA